MFDFNLKENKSKIVLIAIIVLVLVSGFFYAKYINNKNIQDKSKQVMNFAETAAVGLNGEMLKQLKGTPDEVGTTAYESIKKRLEDLKAIDKNIAFTYLFTKKSDKIYFLADSELPQSKDYSPPGQEYTEADSQVFQPFLDGEPLLTKPSTDRWGTWVSAFVPMKDSKTGEIIAVFGIDYSTSYWNNDIFINIINVSLLSLVLLLLFVFLFFFIINKSLRSKRVLIRTKIILFLVIFGFIFFGIFYFFSKNIILKSFSNLENKTNETDLKRLDYSIQNSISELDTKLRDWSNWDDAFKFIQDKNKNFIAVNLSDSAFINLKTNAMFFFDKSGGLVFSKIKDLKTMEDIPTEDIHALLSKNIDFSSLGDKKSSGFLQTQNGTLLFVIEPVFNSLGQGPSSGFLLFGKFIDKDFLDSIRGITLLSIDTFAYGYSQIPEDISLAKVYLSKDNRYYVNPIDADNIAGYFLVLDPENNPVSIIKIINSRDIYKEGQTAMWSYLIITLLLILFFIIVISVLFEIFVLSRLFKLKNNVISITGKDNPIFELEVDQKNDELGDLSVVISRIIKEINSSKDKLKNSFEQEKNNKEEVEKKLLEISKLNNLMVSRELEMVNLKKEIKDLKDKLGQN